jgi:hypothetical protein
VFFNSLRLTWVMALLADAAVILRARALLGQPMSRSLLAERMPTQLSLELEMETTGSHSRPQNINPSNLQ